MVEWYTINHGGHLLRRELEWSIVAARMATVAAKRFSVNIVEGLTFSCITFFL